MTTENKPKVPLYLEEQRRELQDQINSNEGFYTHRGLFCEKTDERIAAREVSRGGLWLILDSENMNEAQVTLKISGVQLKEHGLYVAEEEARSRADIWERRREIAPGEDTHFVKVVRLDRGCPDGAKVLGE